MFLSWYEIRSPRGFTLAEILVALAVLALLILPIQRMFTGSVKTGKVSAHLFAATNLASSLMEAVRSAPPESFAPLPRTRIERAGKPFDLETLGLKEEKGPLARHLTIERGGDEGNFGVYLVTVDVTDEGNPDFRYRLASAVTLRKP